MPAGKFYAIYIERDPDVAYDDVKKAMDLAIDWYRITSRYWIVYTTSDSEKWYGRLKKFVTSSGNLFICGLDTTERQGWMSKDFWDWLREREGSRTPRRVAQ
jgi:hypothetical protein